MCEDLTEARYWEKRAKKEKSRSRRKARALLIKDGDRLIAWALVRPMKGRGYDAEFYTRKAERGKGYGTMLMNEVRKISKRPYVYPHDRRSGGFFRKHRSIIRYDKYDEGWLNESQESHHLRRRSYAQTIEV